MYIWAKRRTLATRLQLLHNICDEERYICECQGLTRLEPPSKPNKTSGEYIFIYIQQRFMVFGIGAWIYKRYAEGLYVRISFVGEEELHLFHVHPSLTR